MVSMGIGQSPNLKRQQRLAMTPSLRQAMTIMAMRVGDLRRFALSASEENPYLDAVLPELPHQNIGDDQGFDFDRVDHETLNPLSLIDHITAQIGLHFHDPDQKAVALAMVEHLAPSGWLDADAWDICSARGMTKNQFDQTLSELQNLEPAGVFARNLAECLKLQLQDLDLLDGDLTIMLDNLDVIPDGIDALIVATGLSQDNIAQGLMKIRQCQPKPGANFSQDEGDIFHPDLVIENQGHGFVITVNQGMMPSLTVNNQDIGTDEASQLLLKKAQEDARLLSRTLARRHDMLLALGQKLIHHQSAFIDQGEAAIMPLTMASLAEEMDVHKTTIGRLVSDKLVMTPRGMIALEDFFSAHVTQPDGKVIASRKIMSVLRGIIADEDPSSPLSDQDLSFALEGKGIIVARRTIAKYRQMIGVSTYAERRQSESIKARK